MNEAARLMLVALVAAVALYLTPDPFPAREGEWMRNGNVWSVWHETSCSH